MGNVQDVPAWIAELPIIQQEIAKKREMEISRRRDAAARIAELKQTAVAAITGLQDKVDQARAAIVAHDDQRKVLQNNLAAAAAALAAEKQGIESDINQAEIILLESYDPEIDRAIVYFRDLHEKLRTKTVDKTTHAGETNLYAWTKGITTFSNYESIVAALRYCAAAIIELEAMKLSPAPDLERIAALKKGMPDVGKMVETTGEKPLPRVVVDERLLLPSDSQMDWELGKLKEKVQMVLGMKRAEPSGQCKNCGQVRNITESGLCKPCTWTSKSAGATALPKLGKRVIERVNGRLVETQYVGRPKN